MGLTKATARDGEMWKDKQHFALLPHHVQYHLWIVGLIGAVIILDLKKGANLRGKQTRLQLQQKVNSRIDNGKTQNISTDS